MITNLTQTKKQVVEDIFDYIMAEGWVDDDLYPDKPYYTVTLPNIPSWEFAVSLHEDELSMLFHRFPGVTLIATRHLPE